MNRLRLLPLLFLSLPPLLLPPIGLEAADGNADPAADTPVYRLKTIPEEASKAQSIDLSGLILPAGSLVNGVRVVAGRLNVVENQIQGLQGKGVAEGIGLL